MSMVARILGALRRRQSRLYYERFRPEIPLPEIYDALAPGIDVDLQAIDGFQRLWSAHLSRTPAVLWPVAPPATPEMIARTARGEARVLTKTFRMTPDTDWHREPFHEVEWPRVHVESCPYSVPGGDLGLLWQLNRMSFLVVDTAVWRASRDPAVADRVYALMESWARANPYLVGANWINPMETGLRLTAWSVSLAGMTDAPLPDARRCEGILRAVLRQAQFLSTHFSHWTIPNNHLIGEAALLSAFATYWPVFKSAPAWLEQAEMTLVQEARRQVLADGFHFESSVNYHLVVLDYFLVYLHACLVRGATPHPFIVEQTQAMAGAALALVAPSGRMPMIGDDSMPHLLVLGGIMGSPGPLGEKVLFEDFLRVEHARLFTTTPWGRDLLALGAPRVHARRFDEAGIDVARDEHSHVVFTHGPQHQRPYSHGHLHSDAASFELELDGVPVFVDSGTYLYDGEPGLRSHMRSTRAHNAVIIDGVEAMEPAATFQWHSVARAEALGFGAHDDVIATGCRQHLPGLQGAGVDHVRALVRIGSTVIITDMLSPTDGLVDIAHTAVLYFHTPVAPGQAVVEGPRVRLTDAAQFVRVFEVLDEPAASVDLIDSPDDHASLYSSSYGKASTGTTIRVSLPVPQTVVVVTVLRAPDVSVTRMRSRVGQIGCAVEKGHVRRIVSLRIDPFAVYVGGRFVAGASGALPDGRSGDPRSLAWLDELDA